MMYVVDLIVLAAVKKAIQHLRENPDESEFLFNNYIAIKSLEELTGGYEYIKQIIDIIQGVGGKELEVLPYYKTKSPGNYGLYIIESGGETIQFIGDQGVIVPQEMPPDLFLMADAVKLEDPNTLVFLNTTIKNILFTGLVGVMNIPSCYFQSKIVMVTSDENFTYVELADPIPLVGNIPQLDGWRFYSSNSYRMINTHSSTDEVSISLLLRTAGDVELHKLFGVIVRYALKSQRQYLDSHGYQVSKIITRSVPQEEGSTQDVIFTTTFNLTGKATDSWVHRKTKVPDQMCLTLQAESGNKSDKKITLL